MAERAPQDIPPPPGWPLRLLEGLCSDKHLEILLGDLEELYEYRYEQKGKRWARFHFIKDALGMLRPFALKKLKSKHKISQVDMFKNHIKIGWRNILRYKGYATINIMGLALGLACCMVLYRFVKDELSYDRFHENVDRIYRVAFSTDDNKLPTNANGSFGPGPAMVAEFPEVEDYVRFKMAGRGAKTLVTHEDKRFYESRFFFADSSIFNVFSFPLIKGNPKTALSEPNTIVLSETASKKYFGDGDPIGKILKADPYNDGDVMQFMVTGVHKDVPGNSHIHFDFLASFYSQKGDYNRWNGFQQVFTYVMLSPQSSPDVVNQKLESLPAKAMGEGRDWYSLSLQPLKDIYLKSNLKSEIEPTSSTTKVTVFTAIAALILVIACINFLTLSTAKSARRAREVGVRKTFGAYRKQLFGQFISEAMLHGFIATVIALSLTFLAFPFVNQVTGKSLALVMDGNWLEVLAMGLVAVLVVAFMAGLYPAVFLSSFKPVAALKSTMSGQGALSKMRKVLVIFQFSISIALIVATIVVNKQMNLVREQSLTQSGDQVIVMPFNRELRKGLRSFEAELDQIPAVKQYSGVSRVPAKGSSTNCFNLSEEVRGCAFKYFVDFGYPETMDYELLAGRLFDKKIGSDSLGAYIITQSAVKTFGFGTPEEAIGQKFGDEGFENGRVIGVIEDFQVHSLRVAYDAAYMLITPSEAYKYMTVRVSPENMDQTLQQMAEAWEAVSVVAPFDYFFLDDAFQQLHVQDMRTGQVVSVMTFLAILIAAIGLFGLASFMTEQRSKEIGIRKVLGAGILSILTLMSKSYLKLVVVASLIGIPASFWALSSWLNAFEYRVTFGFLIFLMAMAIVALVIIGSIGYQSLKAALANPVNSLRNE